jgi:hypothetical protein
LKGERPTPKRTDRRPGGRDEQVEALVRQLATVINGAGSEERGDLREYALGLIRDETEIVDASAGLAHKGPSNSGGPLATAMVLTLAALPLLLLFAPVGLFLLGLAAMMALWSVVSTALRPRLGRVS